jgi:hypothetical protein
VAFDSKWQRLEFATSIVLDIGFDASAVRAVAQIGHDEC